MEKVPEGESSSEDNVIFIKRSRKRRLKSTDSKFDAYKEARKRKETQLQARRSVSNETWPDNKSENSSLSILVGDELKDVNEATPTCSTGWRNDLNITSPSRCPKDQQPTKIQDHFKAKQQSRLKPKKLFEDETYSSSASHKISSLTPSLNILALSIECVVTRKGPLREWGKGMVFDVDLEDDTGKIKATAWNEEAERLYPLLDVGTEYLVKHPWISEIKQSERKFHQNSHNYKITLGNTIILSGMQDGNVTSEDDTAEQEKRLNEVQSFPSNAEMNLAIKPSNSKQLRSTYRIKNCFVRLERLNQFTTSNEHNPGEKDLIDTGESFLTSMNDKEDSPISTTDINDSQEIVNNCKKKGSKITISDDEGSSVSSCEDASSQEGSSTSNSDGRNESSSDSYESDFIDDGFCNNEHTNSTYRKMLSKQIKHLSRQTTDDIANTIRYEKSCFEPQLGTTDKIRKFPSEISDRLHTALQERASVKWLPLSRLMQEFKFLYTTEDNAKMSECICGAPGALRLRTVHWYVNSALYKSSVEQEENRFKVGTNCAYWLQLDHAVYARNQNLDLPHHKLAVYHYEGLMCTFCEDDSDLDEGLFAFLVHPNNEVNIRQTYDTFKNTYMMRNCIEIQENDRLHIYVNKSDFCSYPGDDESMVNDGETIRLKFRTVIQKKRNLRFELIEGKSMGTSSFL